MCLELSLYLIQIFAYNRLCAGKITFLDCSRVDSSSTFMLTNYSGESDEIKKV